MLKKKKPAVNLFEMDTVVAPARPKSVKASASKAAAPKTKKAERAKIATTKTNKVKSRTLMRDEEERAVDERADQEPEDESWEVDLDTLPPKRASKVPEIEHEDTDDQDPEDHGDTDDADPDEVDFSDDDGMTSRALTVPKAPTPSVVTAPPPSRGKISRVDQSKINSIVGDDSDKMLTMLEDETNMENAVKLVKLRLLQTSVDLIPQLETQMRGSDGRYGGHAFNSTIQTIRELIIDLESAADRGAIGSSIVDRVIQPAMREIATTIVEEMAKVLGDVKNLIPEDVYGKVHSLHIESRNRVAKTLNDQYDDIKSGIVAALQR